MQFPPELRYSQEHEWVRVEGDEAVIGLTDFAQHSLGDVVYIEYRSQPGDHVAVGDVVAEVESVKAVSEVFSPVGGELLDTNEDLDGAEELVNQDPYGGGWLLRIRLSDPAQVDALMDASTYQAFVAEQDS